MNNNGLTDENEQNAGRKLTDRRKNIHTNLTKNRPDICPGRFLFVFLQKPINGIIMTAIELNQSLLQEITSISDNENMVRKVLNYVRRLRRQEETEYITKEEILAGIDAGLKDMKAGRSVPFDDFLKELEDEI